MTVLILQWLFALYHLQNSFEKNRFAAIKDFIKIHLSDECDAFKETRNVIFEIKPFFSA